RRGHRPEPEITKVESATAPPATSPSCGQQPLRRPGGPSRSSRQRAAEAILRRARFFGTHAPRDKERDTRQMHAMIKGSRFLEIERAGHISNIEKPEVFNEAVVSFLEECATS